MGLLMRFTSSVTSLAVSKDHTHLAAGSSEFTIKVLELHNLPSGFSLVDHDAPVLSVTFDPRGEFLVSNHNYYAKCKRRHGSPLTEFRVLGIATANLLQQCFAFASKVFNFISDRFW